MKTYRGLFASPSLSVASSVRHQTNRFCCGIYRGDTNKVSRRERKCAVFLVFLHWNIYGNRISFFFSLKYCSCRNTKENFPMNCWNFYWKYACSASNECVPSGVSVCPLHRYRYCWWRCCYYYGDGVCVDIFFVSTINSILFSIHVRFTYVMLLLLHIHSILCVSVVIECVVM